MKFHVIFSGQSSEYIEEIKMLALHPEVAAFLKDLEPHLERECALPEVRRSGYCPHGILPWSWACGAVPVPPASELIRSEVSQPMLFITAMAHAVAARLFPEDRPDIAAYSGHSQGIVAALFSAQGRANLVERAALVARYLMWQGIRMQNSCGWFASADFDGMSLSPMLAVTGPSRGEIQQILERMPPDRRPDISLRNTPDRHVLSGNPQDLALFLQIFRQNFGAESKGRKIWFDAEPLSVSGAYHCRLMAQGRRDIDGDLARLGLDFAAWPVLRPVYSCHDGSRLDQESNITRTLMDIQYTGTVDWPATLRAMIEHHPDVRAAIIPGPGAGLRKLTSGILQGSCIECLPSPESRPNAPEFCNWPQIERCPDGRTAFSSRFTERTGKKPIILAGMTPTTATSRIVAAAANAGYVAELAGGGQVTEKIFRRRMEELVQLLDPGAAVVLNTLYLDPYLFDLHMRKMLFKLRREGFPLRGFTLTAGVPPVGEARALLDKAAEHGMDLCSFKVGTPEQIEQVIAIAKSAPEHFMVIQVEGGEGGGHHGWYSLQNLLSRSYLRLRDLPNVAVAAGGGVRDASDVTRLLSGTWYDGPAPRPLDAVLVGTLAMACAEAETSPAVKEALVAAQGTPDGWPGPDADVISGKSSLGAAIWYLRNTAAHAARMADEAASRPERFPSMREALRKAIDRTAKPYFGDLEEMTYAQWLARFVELTAVGRGGLFENGVWLSDDHEEKFVRMVMRVQQRLGIGENSQLDSQNPAQTVEKLVQAHPELQMRLLEPDRAFFLQLCDEPGKPMPFVPRLDPEIRRRYLSDSLFYSHDARFGADAVLVIPGPRAVGGITRANIPVAQLFDGLLESVACAEYRLSGTAVRREIEVAGPQWISQVEKPWSTLLFSGMVRGKNGILPNPLRTLVVPAKGDRIVFDASEFTWFEGTREKLRIGFPNSSVPQIHGLYFMKMAGGEYVSLPLDFDLPGGWDIPRFDDEAFFAAIDEIYKKQTFLDPAHHEEYAQALGRPAEYRRFAFLPWYASAALSRMVGQVPENPLGLLHYRSRVQLGELQAEKSRFATEIRTVAHTGMQARCHFLSPDSRVAVETDGEFASRHPSRNANLQALPPSAFAREECVFESDVHLGEIHIQSPKNADAFALCGGDRNPLHADTGIARLAGFAGPIHHGLWTQAAVVAEIEKSMRRRPRAISRIQTRFLGPVPFDASLKLRVLRCGRAEGRHLLRAIVEGAAGTLAEMDLHVEAHPTAYICPGQGVQKKGMHEPMYSASEAARGVWDRADKYTRKNLGFSLLHVVRENPVRMEMPNGMVQHPEGVLHLTQFTQVALVVFSCAAVARLREIGAFVQGAHFSGHSLGEYSALSAIGDLLSLEDVVRVVYQRGLTMQHFVPRDDRGESPFRMGVIRPNHAGITEKQMFAMVADIASIPDQYIEIVNYNCRGKQYAVTGYKKGLNELRARLGVGVTGKAPYVEVPGIDVPFHSTLLRAGVDAFRKTLESVFPPEIDPAVLEGRYWPNLTGKPFALSAECIEDVLRRTQSERIANLRQRMESGSVMPGAAARELLVEMLAYQFASPVQWIDIQEGMTRCGVREIVEIGPGHQPTLMNLFAQTLAGMNPPDPPAVLHMEIHFDRIVGQNAEDGFCEFARTTADSEPAEAPTAVEIRESAASAAVQTSAAAATFSLPPTTAAVSARNPVENGLETLLATLSGAWPEEIEKGKSIEDLLQGNSARRNQMLSELQKEFGLKKVDGLADLPLAKLSDAVATQTTGAYRFPGPTLAAARREMFSLLPGLSMEESVRHLTSKYAIDAAGAEAVVSALCAYAREGKSKLTGAPNPFAFPAADAAAARAILDAAATRGLGLSGPASAAQSSVSGAMVDAGALKEMHDKILGPEGVLGRMGALLDDATGRAILMPPSPAQARIAAGVPLEDPVFDEGQIVTFTAAGNWIRECAVRLAAEIESGREPDPESVQLHGRMTEDALQILETARRNCAPAFREKFDAWISELKKSIENPNRANEIQFQIRDLSGTPAALPDFSGVEGGMLVVTGAGPNSIAEGVIRHALSAGWDVVSGVSRLDDGRVRMAASLYRRHAAAGAHMWLVPMRQGNFDDVDAFARWTAALNAAKKPLVLLPFAAIGKNGMAQDAGPEHEIALRVNLLGVERLVGKLAEELAQRRDERTLDVILPMSPNLGDMGGDGLYGESKIALRALLNKWRSEPLLRKKTRMAGAVIGWVRSTGLMHGQDDLAFEIEKALGVKTFDAMQMGAMIFDLARARAALANPEPVTADCTGGLAGIPDWGEAFRKFRAAQAPSVRRPERRELTSTNLQPGALPFPRRFKTPPLMAAKNPKLPWQEWIVVVGYGEIGPFGDEEARWQYELDGKLGPDSILHVALMTGLAQYDPLSGEIVETATKKRMSEKEAAAHFESAVHERVGIRWRPEEGPDAGFMTSLEAVTLGEARLIPMDSLEIARQIQEQDPAGTECVQDASGKIYVRKLPGSKIYIACRRPYRNRVAGMLPSGWTPAFFGFSESEAADRDRNTVMMLIATARALQRMKEPLANITRKIHPSRIGNTLGSGIGGMERLIRLYTDPVWNRKRDPISLQESLGNVGAGHVSQELLGNYGPMVSPVGACATAGISVETAWEKLRLRRADLMAAGAFDDISYAGTIGFDDMSATVDALAMERMGIPPHRMSRPQDRRRKGFVESQGGGTLMLMRAGDAVRLGLPIYGVVGHAWSFGDGFHQSIPAPGFGTLSVARGGASESELARALADYGLTIDDVGVVSMHGTSTPVNDPHETGIFQRIFEELGRTPGHPALAVSQKAVTGHTKGGASALQIIGVLQMMRDHKVPGHRNLDDLDDKQQRFSHLVFPAQSLNVPPQRLKAALVSTLGFGHVSSLVLMLHPGILLSQLEEKERSAYLSSTSTPDAAQELESRWGIRRVVQIPKSRPFEKEEDERRFLLEDGHGKEN